MANTASAKKAVRKIARKTLVNKSRRTLVRNHLRKVEDAVSAGDKPGAQVALIAAESAMMRAANKGLFHKNMAARKIARLNKRVKTLA